MIILALLLFFVSGASALIYEVLWARHLALVFGATTQAASAVLAAFMIGLAGGAAAGGRWADRSRNSLRLYGILEAGIGAAGLLVPVVIPRLHVIYAPLAGDETGTGLALALLRFALAFALLVVPTVLMGATFPILVQAVGMIGVRPLGYLYAANTLGAVAGTLAAGYLLIPWLGLSGTAAAAATGNLVVALTAVLMAARRPEAGSRPAALVVDPRASWPEPDATVHPPAPFPAALPIALLGLSGLTTLATEVLWMRILVFPLWSTTYAFTTMLGAFLAGLALGGAAAGRWLAGTRAPWMALAWLQGLSGLALLIPVACAGMADNTFTAIQNWALGSHILSIPAHIAAVFALLLPQTALAGAAYPLLLQEVAGGGQGVGKRVGLGVCANTVGAAVGAPAAAHLAIPLLGILPTFAALGSLWVALGLLVRLRAQARSWPVAFSGAAGLAAALAACAWGPLAAGRPNPFDDLMKMYEPGARILAYHEGAESTVSVVQLARGPRVIRINGFEAAGVRGDRYTYMQLMAHLPLLLHPNPRDALVISFGTGTTAGAAARHSLATLDMVDLDPGVFAMANHFVAVNHQVLRDPRTRAVVNDGRNFLLLTNRRYDVITMEPMPPTFAGMVNLYSKEFYAVARARLRPGGIMCQWVPFHLMSLDESREVLRTFVEVFPESALWMQGGQGFVIGTSGERLSVNAARLAAGLETPGIRQDLAAAGVGDLVPLLNLLALGPQALRAATANAAVVTDDFPSIEFPAVPFRQPPQWKLPIVRVARAAREIYDRRQSDLPLVTDLSPVLWAELTEYRHVFDRATLGGAASELGEPEKAEGFFRAGFQACRRDRCRAGFALQMGLLAEQRRDLKTARQYLREADAWDPGRPDVQEALQRVGSDGPS